MARAQFQKGQRVWVESVGAWADIEKINAVWAKGFDEPVRVTYDVGMGRDFQASELMIPVEDQAAPDLQAWRVLRARNKWQAPEDVQHHPVPGTYPVVVTDAADWGGWRVPGAEYDRDPERIEFQSRVIVAAPRLMAIAKALTALADDAVDASPQLTSLADQARTTLASITEVLAAPADESAVARRAREGGASLTVAAETRSCAA